ncbi:uncharacterized protein LOC116251470 [Nymphaea colorata]|nr:uncharacterized protein LOC116251470 [Nymphaea colorata]
MELDRPSLWLLFFLLFCMSDPISANAEDKKLPSSPANLEELEFLKGLLDYKAGVGFGCERLRKEQKHMKGGYVGRILKGGAGHGKQAASGRGYRRPPTKSTSSATSFRLSGTFFPPPLLKDLFSLCLVVFLFPL